MPIILITIIDIIHYLSIRGDYRPWLDLDGDLT